MHYKKLISFLLALFISIGTLELASIAQADEPSESETVYLPIIMYHEVKLIKPGRDAITPSEFESDLKYLIDNNYTTISMTDLIEYVYDGKQLPENPIILSFDDGYLNNYVYVLPLLKKYNMKIVLSLLGKNTDEFSNIPDDNIDYSHVTWTQLNEMLDSGLVEVQNHTYNLHKFGKSRIGCCQRKNESDAEYVKVLTEDLGKLQEEIKSNTGRIPNTFAYPYGLFSKSTDSILKNMGFKATLSCDYGINIISRDTDVLYRLKRIGRAHGKSVGKLIDGAYKTIRAKEEK